MAKFGSQKPWQQPPFTTIPSDQVEPEVTQDEEDISGHATDPESDDNVLDKAHEVGLYEESSDEGEGSVEEVGIGPQTEKDEKKHIEEN